MAKPAEMITLLAHLSEFLQHLSAGRAFTEAEINFGR